MNKMDIAAEQTNDAVKTTLMQDHGVNDVIFVSCKEQRSIKHKVWHAAVHVLFVYFMAFI